MLPSETFDISAFIQFPDPVGQSYYGIKDLTPDKYLREISWARSFIRSGVSQKTWEKKIMKVIPALPKDMSKSQVLVANEDGYWITPLKRKDELVRHKVLDLIGDLRLLGMPIKGNIHVARPGHEFNRRLVSFLSDIGNYS